MSLNGNAKYFISILTATSIIATAAVGYGSLKSQTSTNTTNIALLRTDLEVAKTNAGATAAGAGILAQISEINRRLDRIEASQLEVLRLLSRPRNAN